MNRPDIDAILARAEAATKGPWVMEARHHAQNQSIEPELAEIDCGNGHRVASVHITAWKQGFRDARPDARFIAHSREDVPALCQYVRELEAQIERLGARWYDQRHGEGP